MKNRKTAIFIPSFNGGGAEKSMIFLSNALADKGYKVDLITLNSEGVYKSFIQENVNVIDLDKKRVLKSIFSLTKYLKQNRPKVLISALNHTNIASIIAKRLSRVDTKIIITIHSITSRNQNKIKVIHKFKVNYFFKYAQEIVCVSNAVFRDLISNYKLDESLLTVINNPVIYPDIYIKSREKLSLIKKPKELVVLSVGRLESVKNFPLLIRAVEKLLKKGYLIKLLILGEGTEKEYLKSLIVELKMEENVSLLGFRSNVYPYYKYADLFVLPSKTEGSGNVLIEAMAFDLPVIAAKGSGGPEDILNFGELGALFENNNAEDLSDKIEQILLNKHDIKASYKDIKKYEINEIASKYEKMILEV